MTEEKAKPISFAEHFGVDEQKFTELGIFNPIMNFDTKLFVEPLLLKSSNSPFMQQGFESYNTFFRIVLKLIATSKKIGDKCWLAAELLVNFPEYKYTCIGYGADSIDGSGSGRQLNEQILQSAKEIAEFAKNDPDIFQLLPLLEKGIGADIISDMTQKIIDDEICQFTVDAMKKLGVEGSHQHTSEKGNTYLLCYNPYHKCVVKLLPQDVLSNLPLAESFDDWLTDSATFNRNLRDTVNKHIGQEWYESSKSDKKETLLGLIKTEKDFFLSVLSALEQANFEHYDVDKDSKGLRRWLEDSEQLKQPDNLGFIEVVERRQEALFKAVELVIAGYKELIEHNDGWRLFWTEHKSEIEHVNEFYSQMLFYLLSRSWLDGQGSNVMVDKHFNPETKQWNIIFSISNKCRVTVQIKHANNGSGLKAMYEKQCLFYKENKAKRSFYVVINFKEEDSKQLTHIKNNEEEGCKIVEVMAIQPDNQGSLLDGIYPKYEGLEDDESRYRKEKQKRWQKF